jgi:putative transposase
VLGRPKTAQGPSPAEQDEAELVAEIRAIHNDSNGTYGSPRVCAELARNGRRVNHKRVERLMRAHDIVGHRPRKRRSLTKQDAQAPPAPDLVGRLFDPDNPDHTWAGDITHIRPTKGGCIWPPRWIWRPGGCWDGRWTTTCALSWSAAR